MRAYSKGSTDCRSLPFATACQTSVCRLQPMPRLTPIPALQDNYIWTLATDDGRALVIDPGEAAPLTSALNGGLNIAAVLITHHHPDHIGGLAALLEQQSPPPPVYAPVDSRIPGDYIRVAGSDAIPIPGLAAPLQVIDVPGHTLTHIAFFDDQHLFCGDTLFSLGCGRLFEGTPEQMLRSLDRIAALPSALKVCCAHEYTEDNARFALQVEPDNRDLRERADQARIQRRSGQPTLPTTLGEERRCNPFLRVDTPAIRQSVERWMGRSSRDRTDTFAGLRQMKDQFR